MSAAATRMPFAQAYVIATHFADLIRDHCDRLVIAGSLRRRTNTVGDVEICAIPTVIERPTGLFADITEPHDLLAEALDRMLAEGIVTKRETNGKTAWGPKHKRLTFEGAPVDLFCAERERFGLILAIRTGPFPYSHQLVTEKGKPCVGRNADGRMATRMGLLPSHLRVQGGWLTSRVSGQRIATPEEVDFYIAAGLPWIEPEDRR